MPVNPDKLQDAVRTITEAAKENPELLDVFNKPKGAGKGSNYSYYNRDTATMVKRIVDIMVADPEKKDQMLFVKDFKTVSRNSLVVRCWQGFKYLIERMDTNGTYTELRDKISIRKSTTGVRFMWKEISHITSTAVLPEERSKEWKDTFDEFIEGAASGDVYARKDLDLDSGDIEYIRRSLVNLPEFRVFKLTNNEIKIGRTI